jgi:CBS domain-containing protein
MPRVYEHMIREPVGNCDPRPAICVHPDTQVADAIALMKQHSCGCVLVQAGDRLLGIFTERDVLLRVAGAGLDTRRTVVSSVMTPDPETLTMRDELAWVLNLMAVGGFRHVPIVDDAGKPIAIVSMQHIVERLVECFPKAVLTLPPRPGADIAHTREGA